MTSTFDVKNYIKTLGIENILKAFKKSDGTLKSEKINDSSLRLIIKKLKINNINSVDEFENAEKKQNFDEKYENERKQEIPKQNLEEIFNNDLIVKEGVNVKFGFESGNSTEEIKRYLIQLLDKIDLNDKWFFKFAIRRSDKEEWSTLPLNSENIVRVKNMLDLNQFETDFDLLDQEDQRQIVTSDSNIDYFNYYLDSNNISQISIIPYVNTVSDKTIKVYSENSGAFYDSKLNEEFISLESILIRYQIFNSILNSEKEPRNELNYNCFVYALIMSGKFSNSTIQQIAIRCFTRTISRIKIEQIAKDFHFKVIINKYNQVNNEWNNIIKSGKKRFLGDENSSIVIELGLIRNHYFLKETIQGLSSFYLNNFKSINEYCVKNNKDNNWARQVIRIKNNKYEINTKESHIDSTNFISLIEKLNMTSKLTFSDRSLMKCDLYQYVDETIDELTDCSNDYKNIIEKSIKKISKTITNSNGEKIQKNPSVWYADCESDVSSQIIFIQRKGEEIETQQHQVYCISFSKRGDDKIECVFGKDCIEKFFDRVDDNDIVYFHNLGYDSRLMKNFKIKSAIDKGSRIMNETITYNKKQIHLKDSYAILSVALDKFSKMFGIKDCAKEMFPYRYYTMKRLFGEQHGIGSIKNAGKGEIQSKWDQKQFEENIIKIGALVEKDKFDMFKYCEFYCNQDVNILKTGFDKFRLMCLSEPIKVDIDYFISAASIADYYFNLNVYSKVDDMKKYSGVTRAFIQKCVYGGRCMCSENKKWHIDIALSDFDAVSLYPSAMKRLYCISGSPIILNKNQLTREYLLNNCAAEDDQISLEKPLSAYCVEINILKVGKHLKFPLICKRDPETHTNRNVNECVKMFVDNIVLEDLIKYQQIEFEVVRGYAWTGKKDFNIRTVIQTLHEYRVQYKKQENKMEEVIKLIMNSSYGKCIQKPIKTNTEYKAKFSAKKEFDISEVEDLINLIQKALTETNEEEYSKITEQINCKGISRSNLEIKLKQVQNRIKIDDQKRKFIFKRTSPSDNFCKKNHARIREIYEINENLDAITVNKQIDDFYTNTLLGVQILSMSKRLMNEVMCTAEDLKIELYYQDTDSMHIQYSKIPLLEEKFMDKYGRKLIGKDLGQYHSDFKVEGWNTDNIWSDESFFLGKKAYVDKLCSNESLKDYLFGITKEIKYEYHIRMKGVDLKCVNLVAKDQFDNKVIDLYNYLFEGNSIEFDLLATKPRFEMCKNRSVQNVPEFKRTIEFLNETEKNLKVLRIKFEKEAIKNFKKI